MCLAFYDGFGSQAGVEDRAIGKFDIDFRVVIALFIEREGLDNLPGKLFAFHQ
jgi:hypothetical protein